MAKLPQSFDSNDIEPNKPFEPIPAGRYPMQIIESENKIAKSGNGEYLQITLEVLDGEHKGRRVFVILNLVNTNQTAVEIAYRDLSAICRAVGVRQVDDSEQLHNKPFTGVVKIKHDPGYDPQNALAGYEPLGTAAPASPTPSPTSKRNPWERDAAA